MSRRETDNEFLLHVLWDGVEHEKNDILARSLEERGCGLTVNSRASNLRARGYTVTNRLEKTGDGRTLSFYRLEQLGPVAGLKEASATGPHPAGVSLSPIIAVSEEEEWEGLRALDDFPIPTADADGFAESSGDQLGLLGSVGSTPGAHSVEAA